MNIGCHSLHTKLYIHHLCFSIVRSEKIQKNIHEIRVLIFELSNCIEPFMIDVKAIHWEYYICRSPILIVLHIFAYKLFSIIIFLHMKGPAYKLHIFMQFKNMKICNILFKLSCILTYRELLHFDVQKKFVQSFVWMKYVCFYLNVFTSIFFTA